MHSMHAPMEALVHWAETMPGFAPEHGGGGPLQREVRQSYTMIYVYELEGGVVQVYTAGQF